MLCPSGQSGQVSQSLCCALPINKHLFGMFILQVPSCLVHTSSQVELVPRNSRPRLPQSSLRGTALLCWLVGFRCFGGYQSRLTCSNPDSVCSDQHCGSIPHILHFPLPHTLFQRTGRVRLVHASLVSLATFPASSHDSYLVQSLHQPAFRWLGFCPPVAPSLALEPRHLFCYFSLGFPLLRHEVCGFLFSC